MKQQHEIDTEAHRRAGVRALLCRDYHETFGTDAGRRVLADLKACFNPMDAVFSSLTGYDPVKAALKDGQRHVLIHILTALEETRLADGNTATKPPPQVLT